MLKQGQLIHFMHLPSFKYVLENITKPDVFRAYRESDVQNQMFSGRMERNQWREMG